MKKLLFSIFILTGVSLFAQTTIETQLLVTTNEGTNGGSFKVAIQAKGTNLTADRTIGSATIDVYYTASHLAPVIVGGTIVQGTYNAAINPLAYGRSLNYVAGGPYVRLSLNGANVNSNGDGTPAGFDLTSLYQTLVTINFTILNNAVTTNLTIATGSLTIGLFDSPNNSNLSGNIIPQTMSPPLNIVNEPLPVELSSFTSKFLNDKIQLDWITNTEVNNYGFNVERRINEGEWNSIGFVEGHGNSNSPKEYSYADKDLFAGGSNFQYRLKQIDTDGQFDYSDVVEVEVVPTQFELSQNFPNPFNPSTTIQFSLPQATQIKISLYNMIGEQVATIAEGMYESGYHKVVLDAANLSSGTYIYRLESSDFVQVKKMMLIK